MPGCIVSAMTASFRSVEKRRRRATPVITSTFENVSDIGVCLGLYLGPPAKAGVRSKRGQFTARVPGRQDGIVVCIGENVILGPYGETDTHGHHIAAWPHAAGQNGVAP